MALLLYSDMEREGMIATPSDKVDGVAMPPRRYYHDGHIVVLDNNLPHVLEHDAREICKIAGYRLASPQESNAYYAGKRNATVLTESTTENDTPAPEPAPTPAQVLTSDNAPASSPRTRRKG